jgi:hypothetical protein
MPARMTVAAPVCDDLPMSRTGRRVVSVKYPVSAWIAAASTMPMTTAPTATSRGLPSTSSTPPPKSAKSAGRYTQETAATSTADSRAER